MLTIIARLKMEPWRACRPEDADLHHFNEEKDPGPHQRGNSDPDPHQIEKSDYDPHQSDKRDPDPHQSDVDPQHCLVPSRRNIEHRSLQQMLKSE
jgi:hypothetical protein